MTLIPDEFSSLDLWLVSRDSCQADVINTVKRNNGLGVFYWGPECTRDDGMWNADGSAAPSISVMDRLEELKARPSSMMPPGGRP